MLFNARIYLSNKIRKLIAWADIVYIPRLWYSAILTVKACGKPVLLHLHDYNLICPISSLYDFRTESICHLSVCSKKCIYAYEKVNGRSLPAALTSTTLNATLGGQLSHLASLSDKILCVSRAQKNIIIKQLPQLKEKTAVIYNPMPTLSPSPITGDDLGFLGGPNPAKGFRILHSALKHVKLNNAILHATNFSELKQEQLANVKIFYYKKLGPTQLDDFYTKIQTLIFPSICPEPLPNALCEAILRGRLAIVSNIGGIPEIVQGCKGIFQFEAANIEQLTELIEYTYSLSAQKAAELAAYDRELFASRFNNDIAIDKFVNCCTELLND